MIEVKTKLRRWGNSFGLVVPLSAVASGKMNEGDDILVLMRSEKNDAIKELFGKLKSSRTSKQILKEVRREFESKWEKSV